ncbi:MAG: glycosyltransferase [bacterium]
MKKPLVSVIIVNYNGQAYLEKCLKSIGKSTPFNFEVLVVDNGSSNFNASPLNPLIPLNPLKVIKLPSNFGPAYARNRGAEKAQGKYLAFLDNDTEVHQDWLKNAVEILEKDQTIGALQCKLLLNKDRNRFDYAGDYLTQWGFLTQVISANTKDTHQVKEGLEILAAKSAGMFIRADTFLQIGGFDKDYFIFMEETDLCWRVWLSTRRVVFTNLSVVYHEFGTTTLIDPKLQGINSKFHGTKNYITTLIKNLEAKNLAKILPWHLSLWIGLALFLLAKGRVKDAFLTFRGIWWAISHLPQTLKKRRQIQKSRQVKDKDLFPKIYRSTLFSQFYKKLTLAKPLGNAKPFFAKKEWPHPAVGLYRAAELYHTSKVLGGPGLELKEPILDLGCGDGKVAKLQFGEWGANHIFLGLENSPEWVEKAQKSGFYQKVFLGDARQIPLEAASVGAIFSNSVLEHIVDVQKVFPETYRILKKGGYFVFTVSSQNFAKNLLFSPLCKAYGPWRAKTIGVVNDFKNEQWVKLGKKAGFNIVHQSQSVSPQTASLYDFLALAAKLPPLVPLLRLITKHYSGYTETALENGSDLLIIAQK